MLVAGCAAPSLDEESGASEAALSGDPVGPGDATPEQILAKLGTCKKLSNAPYALDAGERGKVDVCKLKNAVYFKADMDIDCDGKESAVCNRHTDGAYQSETAATDSGGDPLDAAELPYIVLPGASSKWSFSESGIKLGSVAAVIYNGKIEFGIVGDIGPKAIIGEASYAMAKSLGINPNPSTGGTDSGVTYVVFTGSSGVVGTNEDHEEAFLIGRIRAAQLLREN